MIRKNVAANYSEKEKLATAFIMFCNSIHLPIWIESGEHEIIVNEPHTCAINLKAREAGREKNNRQPEIIIASHASLREI